MNESDLNVFVSNAIQWARERVDSTDYNFRCLSFVEDAYERGNSIEIFGGSSAKESADLYEAYLNTGIPAKGAFVFFDCYGSINGQYQNWGHVGLSIGGGEVIHAWDKVRIDSYQDIQNLQVAPGWTKPNYNGWAPAERILLGFIGKEWEKG